VNRLSKRNKMAFRALLHPLDTIAFGPVYKLVAVGQFLDLTTDLNLPGLQRDSSLHMMVRTQNLSNRRTFLPLSRGAISLTQKIATQQKIIN